MQFTVLGKFCVLLCRDDEIHNSNSSSKYQEGTVDALTHLSSSVRLGEGWKLHWNFYHKIETKMT